AVGKFFSERHDPIGQYFTVTSLWGMRLYSENAHADTLARILVWSPMGLSCHSHQKGRGLIVRIQYQSLLHSIQPYNLALEFLKRLNALHGIASSGCYAKPPKTGQRNWLSTLALTQLLISLSHFSLQFRHTDQTSETQARRPAPP